MTLDSLEVASSARKFARRADLKLANHAQEISPLGSDGERVHRPGPPRRRGGAGVPAPRGWGEGDEVEWWWSTSSCFLSRVGSAGKLFMLPRPKLRILQM